MHRTAQGPTDLALWRWRQRECNELFRRKASERSHQSQRITGERTAKGMRRAADASTLVIPAERFTRNGCTPTLKTNIKLWALPRCVKEGELSPTRHERIGSAGLQKIPSVKEQLIEFGFGLLIARSTFDQLGDVPGDRRAAESTAQAEPDSNAAHLGHGVKGPPRDQGKVKLGERLYAPAEAAGRLADPLGDRLELAACRGEEGEHAIGFAEAETRGDNGQRRSALTCRHDAQGSIDPQPRRVQTRRVKGKGGA